MTCQVLPEAALIHVVFPAHGARVGGRAALRCKTRVTVSTESQPSVSQVTTVDRRVTQSATYAMPTTRIEYSLLTGNNLEFGIPNIFIYD